MKKRLILSVFIFCLAHFISAQITEPSLNSIEEIEERRIPIDGGRCTATLRYNNQPINGAIALNSSARSITISLQTTCFVVKIDNRAAWLGFPSTNVRSSFTVNITANNSPNDRSTLVSLLDEGGDFVGVLGIRQSGNSSFRAYYPDTDGDGFGDFNAEVVNATSAPSNHVTNNLDICPNEYSTSNDGCIDAKADQNYNWTKSYTYDINGKLIGASKSYFDDLGKGIQSQTYDAKYKKVWAAETRYDVQGRPALQTMSAPIAKELSEVSFGYKQDFIQKTTGAFTNADFETANVLNPSIVGNQENSLGWYYSTANNDEPLQDITTRPYSRTIYSDLKPGSVRKTIGGNKIGGQWKQGYTFTMPAAQELYYVFGYERFPKIPEIASTYKNYNVRSVAHGDNIHIAFLRANKTVTEDLQGNESVVFTDSNGKTLGAARSGIAEDVEKRKQYEVLSLIGKQGFVDVHIPEGCENTLQFVGNSNVYKVYDLKTEIAYTTTPNTLPKGFYRIEYIGDRTLLESSNLTYIDKLNGSIKPLHTGGAGTPGVRYKVNYYNFSLNYYNDSNQLTESLSPIGFDNSCFDDNKVKATVTHQEDLKSTFAYDVLGQLVTTTSPDEGTANFKYRKDGQIRFSQNSKQAAVGEFSYTNYDELGRPIESGVCTGNFSTLNPDNTSFSGTKKEQHHTKYDFLENTDTAYLRSVNSSYANPSFLASNVAKTSNENSITYYSYDVYGRIQWIVQKLIGFSTTDKTVTIDYEYDPITSQVLQVVFQKHIASEKFIHKYAYDADSQKLIKVETSTNGSNYITHADYTYYETGAMKRTSLAGGIQDIDYVYNLAGQLKSINHPSLFTDTQLNPGGKDLFGVTLDYYSGDYLRDPVKFTNSTSGVVDQYNGNIKGMTWNTNVNGNSGQLQYKYAYDRNNWLKSALFDGMDNQQNNAPENIILNTNSTISQQVIATNSIVLQPGFHVAAASSRTFSGKIVPNTEDARYGVGDYNVTNLEYDANGNIKKLFRNKNTERIRGVDTNKMDQLSYVYKTNKPNQLLRVEDAITGDTHANDIKTQTGNNYVYNEIGQLTDNVGEHVAYEYNVNGLVTLVKYNGKDKVRFYYNDKNFRTKKVSYKNDGVTVEKTTDYVLDGAGQTLAIYENQIQKELPIYGASRLGVYNKATNTSVYQLTDHLGNVRAVIAKDGNGNTGAITSATDYYPFGMAMPNRKWGANGYRYAYQGQEIDPETGKEAFQLRLWDGRIGRWLTTDPKGQYYSPYLGMGNNPMNGVDPDGGKFYTDYKNKQTGATAHVNDGKTQTVEVDNSVWDSVLYLSENGITSIYSQTMNDILLANSTFLSATSVSFNSSDLKSAQSYQKNNIAKGASGRDDCLETVCNTTKKIYPGENLRLYKAASMYLPGNKKGNNMNKTMQHLNNIGKANTKLTFIKNDGDNYDAGIGSKLLSNTSLNSISVWGVSVSYAYHSAMVYVKRTSAHTELHVVDQHGYTVYSASDLAYFDLAIDALFHGDYKTHKTTFTQYQR